MSFPTFFNLQRGYDICYNSDSDYLSHQGLTDIYVQVVHKFKCKWAGDLGRRQDGRLILWSANHPIEHFRAKNYKSFCLPFLPQLISDWFIVRYHLNEIGNPIRTLSEQKAKSFTYIRFPRWFPLTGRLLIFYCISLEFFLSYLIKKNLPGSLNTFCLIHIVKWRNLEIIIVKLNIAHAVNYGVDEVLNTKLNFGMNLF